MENRQAARCERLESRNPEDSNDVSGRALMSSRPAVASLHCIRLWSLAWRPHVMFRRLKTLFNSLAHAPFVMCFVSSITSRGFCSVAQVMRLDVTH